MWVRGSHLVAARAAALTAAGIGAILEHTQRVETGTTVAIDGSVYELYPNFKGLIEQGLVRVLGAAAASRVKLVLAKDGSGVGAALIAALATDD